MSLSDWPKRKLRGKQLYNLSEDEYRSYMRERLSEAREEMSGRQDATTLQMLVTLVLIAGAGLICLHHFGFIVLVK